TSLQYFYVAGLEGEGFEFHLGEQAFAGVFPTHGGEANVWVCSPAGGSVEGTADRSDAFMGLLGKAAPSLAKRVRSALITSPVRGASRLPNHIRQAVGPGWALVGDAGYHRDPITGHRIADAFRDAELLARHLGQALRHERSEASAMTVYDRKRRLALAPIFDVTVRLSQFPHPSEFVELQKRLSKLLDIEAAYF